MYRIGGTTKQTLSAVLVQSRFAAQRVDSLLCRYLDNRDLKKKKKNEQSLQAMRVF
jgi:hypothetical protein